MIDRSFLMLSSYTYTVCVNLENTVISTLHRKTAQFCLELCTEAKLTNHG